MKKIYSFGSWKALCKNVEAQGKLTKIIEQGERTENAEILWDSILGGYCCLICEV